jgi:phage-related protein
MYTTEGGDGQGYQLTLYRTSTGRYPAKEFMDSLPERARIKSTAWLRLLEEDGPNLRRPYADVLEEPIRELRVSFGRLEIRLLYFFAGRKIIVTHGFLKKTRQVDRTQIDLANRYRAEWLGSWGDAQS